MWSAFVSSALGVCECWKSVRLLPRDDSSPHIYHHQQHHLVLHGGAGEGAEHEGDGWQIMQGRSKDGCSKQGAASDVEGADTRMHACECMSVGTH